MTDRKLILRTTVASVLLHLLLGALTWNLKIAGDEVTRSALASDEVELFLLPEEPAPASETEEQPPTAYTEVPDRLASETPPDRADFLALNDSRAADRLPGGQDNNRPGTEQEAEFPQVSVQREDLAGAAGVVVEEPALTAPEDRPQPQREQSRPEPQEEQIRREGEEADAAGDWLLERPQEGGEDEQEGEAQGEAEAEEQPEWLENQPAPSILKEGNRHERGDRGFDFDQMAQSTPGANTAVEGDFSLNTYEWEWAPWLHRFAQNLHRNWMAPYAYRLGIIDGYTRIRLVVEKDGRVSSMEIVETEGHESLHKASQAALTAFAPYAPLPPDFPEENLVILLSLHYPAWKR